MKVADRFSSTSVVTGGRRATERTEGAGIFFQRGSQIYKKSALIKLRPPYFGNKNFMTPHHRYTLPPKQAKNCIEISLFEQNKHTTCICGHFVTPYILWPPIFFPKIYEPPVYLGPPSEENASPLTFDAAASKPLTRSQEARVFFAAQKMHVSSRVDSN